MVMMTVMVTGMATVRAIVTANVKAIAMSMAMLMAMVKIAQTCVWGNESGLVEEGVSGHGGGSGNDSGNGVMQMAGGGWRDKSRQQAIEIVTRAGGGR
jgi:hypothetical protein